MVVNPVFLRLLLPLARNMSDSAMFGKLLPALRVTCPKYWVFLGMRWTVCIVNLMDRLRK